MSPVSPLLPRRDTLLNRDRWWICFYFYPAHKNKNKSLRKRLVGVCILFYIGDKGDRQAEVSCCSHCGVPKAVPRLSPTRNDWGQKGDTFCGRRIQQINCSGAGLEESNLSAQSSKIKS